MNRWTRILMLAAFALLALAPLAAQNKDERPTVLSEKAADKNVDVATPAPKPSIHTYRFDFVITELDGNNKKVSVSTPSIIADNEIGSEAKLDISTRVPIHAPSTSGGSTTENTVVEYVNIGTRISLRPVRSAASGEWGKILITVDISKLTNLSNQSDGKTTVHSIMVGAQFIIKPGKKVTVGSPMDQLNGAPHYVIEVTPTLIDDPSK